MAIPSKSKEKEKTSSIRGNELTQVGFDQNQAGSIEDYFQKVKDAEMQIKSRKMIAEDHVINTIRRKIIDEGFGREFYEFICSYYLDSIESKWLKNNKDITNMQTSNHYFPKYVDKSYLTRNKNFFECVDFNNNRVSSYFDDSNMTLNEFLSILPKYISESMYSFETTKFFRDNRNLIWDNDTIQRVVDLGFRLIGISLKGNVKWSKQIIEKFFKHFVPVVLLENKYLLYELGIENNVETQEFIISLANKNNIDLKDKKPENLESKLRIHEQKLRYSSLNNPPTLEDLNDINRIHFSALYNNPLAPIDWEVYFRLFDRMTVKNHYFTANVYNKVFKPVLNDYILENTLPIILY